MCMCILISTTSHSDNIFQHTHTHKCEMDNQCCEENSPLFFLTRRLYMLSVFFCLKLCTSVPWRSAVIETLDFSCGLVKFSGLMDCACRMFLLSIFFNILVFPIMWALFVYILILATFKTPDVSQDSFMLCAMQ